MAHDICVIVGPPASTLSLFVLLPTGSRKVPRVKCKKNDAKYERISAPMSASYMIALEAQRTVRTGDGNFSVVFNHCVGCFVFSLFSVSFPFFVSLCVLKNIYSRTLLKSPSPLYDSKINPA